MFKTTQGVILGKKKAGVFAGYLYPGVHDEREARRQASEYSAWLTSGKIDEGKELSKRILTLLDAGQPIPPEIDAEMARIGPVMECPYQEVLCDQDGPVTVLPGGLYAIGNDGTTWQKGKRGQWTKTSSQ